MSDPQKEPLGYGPPDYTPRVGDRVWVWMTGVMKIVSVGPGVKVEAVDAGGVVHALTRGAVEPLWVGATERQ